MTAFESIKQGLTEAIAFADGKNTKAVVHIVDVPVVDVAAIRASTGLSQASALARALCSTGSRAVGAQQDPRRCCLL